MDADDPRRVKADIVLEHLRVWESKHTMPTWC